MKRDDRSRSPRRQTEPRDLPRARSNEILKMLSQNPSQSFLDRAAANELGRTSPHFSNTLNLSKLARDERCRCGFAIWLDDNQTVQYAGDGYVCRKPRTDFCKAFCVTRSRPDVIRQFLMKLMSQILRWHPMNILNMINSAGVQVESVPSIKLNMINRASGEHVLHALCGKRDEGPDDVFGRGPMGPVFAIPSGIHYLLNWTGNLLPEGIIESRTYMLIEYENGYLDLHPRYTNQPTNPMGIFEPEYAERIEATRAPEINAFLRKLTSAPLKLEILLDNSGDRSMDWPNELHLGGGNNTLILPRQPIGTPFLNRPKGTPVDYMFD